MVGSVGYRYPGASKKKKNKSPGVIGKRKVGILEVILYLILDIII